MRFVLSGVLVCAGLLAGAWFYSVKVHAQSARKPILIQSAIQTVQSDGTLKTTRYLTIRSGSSVGNSRKELAS
jgi:hypothetical protein